MPAQERVPADRPGRAHWWRRPVNVPHDRGMLRRPLDGDRHLAQEQPRPDRERGGKRQHPEHRRGHQGHTERPLVDLERGQQDGVDPCEQEDQPASEPVRRFEEVVMARADLRHRQHADRQEGRDDQDRDGEAGVVDAGFAIGPCRSEQRDVHHVPERAREGPADVRAAEMVVLREPPPDAKGPVRRGSRREPGDRVHEPVLAREDREQEVHLRDRRDDLEAPRVRDPPSGDDPRGEDHEVDREHERHEQHVRHEPRMAARSRIEIDDGREIGHSSSRGGAVGEPIDRTSGRARP